MAFPSDPFDWGWIGAAALGAYSGARWWYHVRKLNNADKVDGSVTASLKFVLDELHQEIDDLKAEVRTLKTENQDLRAQLTERRA